MVEEKQLQEVHEAVNELRKSFEAGTLTEEKRAQIDTVLDDYEKKNQELTVAQEELKSHKKSIETFQEELEEKGVKFEEMEKQVGEFQVALAKSISDRKSDNFKDTPEYKAFEQYVIEGMEGFQDVETKATLRTDAATEGGVLVSNEMESQIVKKIYEVDPIRQVARVRPTSTKSLTVPIETAINSATYEGEAGTSQESTPAYGSETLTAYRQTVTIPITRDMLMDAAFDMEAEIMDVSARAFAVGESNAFVVGSGDKVPYGILTDSRIERVSSVSTTAGEIHPDDILKIQGELKTGYDGTSALNRRVLATLRMTKSTSGGYLWAPGIDGQASATLGGDPYILANSMPNAAVDSESLIYGDFGIGYLIVDRTATEVIRDDFTRKKDAIVEFTVHRWNNAKVVLPEALKILTLDN